MRGASILYRAKELQENRWMGGNSAVAMVEVLHRTWSLQVTVPKRRSMLMWASIGVELYCDKSRPDFSGPLTSPFDALIETTNSHFQLACPRKCGA